MADIKPLNWTPKPGVGMTVARRPDGGMTLTFTDMSEATLKEWHDFALEHLLGVDRLTRNLYDLRAVQTDQRKGRAHRRRSQQRPVCAQHPAGCRRRHTGGRQRHPRDRRARRCQRRPPP